MRSGLFFFHAPARQRGASFAYAKAPLRLSASGSFCAHSDMERSSSPEKMRCIARALSETRPKWVFCPHAAAAFHGFYVSGHLARRIHVAHGSPKHPKGRGIIVHHKKKSLESTHVNKTPVTSLLETTIDCHSRSSFIDGLPVADSALARLGISYANSSTS